MGCEFQNEYLNPQRIFCCKVRALPQVKAKLADFTVTQLMKLLCQNSDRDARQECCAYQDLVSHGRNSQWAKK